MRGRTAASFLDRAERTVTSRIGAGQDGATAFFSKSSPRRWLEELIADGMEEVAAELLTTAVGELLQTVEAGDVQHAKDQFEFLRDRMRNGSPPKPGSGSHYLYRLYDSAGDLLYIGISDRGPVRLTEHYRFKPWFDMVTRVEFERYPTRAMALQAEAGQIVALHPRHNIQHNGGNQVRPA